MSDIADAADLLATARETLLSELLPALPNARRYAALMIANAIAIAERERRLGPDTAQREATRLRALLAAIEAGAAPASIDVAPLRSALRAAIRAGRFDEPTHASAITDQLLRTAEDWLAISNPKALRAPWT